METIETMNILETAERLRAAGMKISADTVRRDIQQKIFPFGDCIEMDSGPRCYIYVNMLEDWIAQRVSKTA